MVGKRRSLPNVEIGQTSELRLIANLLGILITKEMSEGDKIATLNAAGFGNQEIARILRKDANTVKVTLSQRRKRNAQVKK